MKVTIKNKEYDLFFYPCGNYAMVKKDGYIREVKYSPDMSCKDFFERLTKIMEVFIL